MQAVDVTEEDAEDKEVMGVQDPAVATLIYEWWERRKLTVEESMFVSLNSVVGEGPKVALQNSLPFTL